MGFKFPYGNQQQLNLDWFIRKFKELVAAWNEKEESIDGALDAEIQRAEDALTDVYTARDVAVAAKNDALTAKADALTAAANSAQYWQNSAASAQSAATSAGTALSAAGDAAEDAQQTARDRASVTADKAAVAADKATVASDAAQVAADKATVAQDKADTDTIKDNANAAALRSEGWADGTQYGTPVTSDSPYYENNAKYYKEAAEDVLESIPPDYSELAAEVSEQSEKIEAVSDEIFNNEVDNIALTNIVDNKYITNLGILGNSANWSATEDFILCEDYDELVFDCTQYTRDSAYNAWYRSASQSSDSFIDTFTLDVGTITINRPQNARYFRVSALTTDLATLTVIGKKDSSNIDILYGRSPLSPVYLKLMTWNVGLFNDGSTRVPTADAPAQIIKFKTFLGKSDPDILNTQEFLKFFDAGLTISSVDIMSFKYKDHYTDDGVPIFSKITPHNAETVMFSSGDSRGYVYFDVNIQGKTVTIANTHLTTEVDPTIHRNDDIAELIAFMNTKDYVILSGDFNVYTDAEFDAFKTAGYVLCNGGDFGWFKTWPVNISGSLWGTEHLDNIIVSSNIIPQYVETMDVEISDHAPLLATLRIV